MNLNFLTNPTQRVATGKRLPTAELETLLLYGDHSIRLKVLAKAAPNGHVLAANPNTYHLMEALCRVSDPSSLAELVFAIRRQVSALAQSRYGNVVIQEILKKVPSVVKNDLVVSIVEQAFQISTGEFGNRVIQVLLKDPVAADKLYDALLPNFIGLATNEFGQIVVGHGLSLSHDSPFWAPLMAGRQIVNACWNNNRHHVLLPLIQRAGSFSSTADANTGKAFRLVSTILIGELVIPTFARSYGSSDDKKEQERDDEEKKMTPEECDEFMSERCNIINALLSAGQSSWREMISTTLLEIVQQQNKNTNNKSKASPKSKKAATKNKKQNDDDAAAAVVVEEEEEQNLILRWTKKQHLCNIVEALIRENAQQQQQDKKNTKTKEIQQQIAAIFKDESLIEMIGHRYAASVAKELVRHSVADNNSVYLAQQHTKVVQSLISQSASLVNQSSYSSLFQTLAQSSKQYADALADILLTSSKQQDVEKKVDADSAATTKKNKQQQNKKKNEKHFDDKQQERDEDKAAADLEEEEEIKNLNKPVKTLVEASIDHPSASHLLQCLLGLSVEEGKISAKKRTALADAVYNRIMIHPAILSRTVTSPHGSHVVQALLRVVSDAQIKAFTELCPKARVNGKFFGTPALARNKYGCHAIVVLLTELKRRKVALESKSAEESEEMMETLRSVMNALKPNVHFLALAASTGRHVFETMCKVGSDQLKQMMTSVVALKCESYLKGDPYQGEDDEKKRNNGAGRKHVKQHAGKNHPFKAKHDAKRRQRE